MDVHYLVVFGEDYLLHGPLALLYLLIQVEHLQTELPISRLEFLVANRKRLDLNFCSAVGLSQQIQSLELVRMVGLSTQNELLANPVKFTPQPHLVV